MTVFKKQSFFLIVLLCVVTMLCSCNKVDLTTTYHSQSSTQSGFSNQSFHITNDRTTITEAEKSTKYLFDNNMGTSALTTNPSVATENIKKYTNSHNGIVLSVYSPENVVFGEKIYVVAKITNNSSENITYTLPSCTPNSHLEIRVDINDGRKSFIDYDTFGRPLADLTITKTLLTGEYFEETICFLPGWTEALGILELDKSKITMFDKGVYTGTAVFNWDTEEDIDSISLEFPIVIV